MSVASIQERYLAALHFAARAHQGQLYPGTELSYIMHLSFVAMEVLAAHPHEPDWDAGFAVQCALLHDVLEDTDRTRQQLADAFGDAVAAGVEALTKSSALPKPQRMPDSLQRIRQQPREVWIVKLADRISNLQSPPPHWDAAKQAGYRDEAQTILDALGEASPYLAARLSLKIRAYSV